MQFQASLFSQFLDFEDMSTAHFHTQTILPRIVPHPVAEPKDLRIQFQMTLNKALQSIAASTMNSNELMRSSNAIILPPHLANLLTAPIQVNISPEQIELAVIDVIAKLFPQTQVSIEGQLTINTDTSNITTIKFCDRSIKSPAPSSLSGKSSSSKRKSYHPTKYTSPVAHQASGATSPSIDSGALDLSRASSMTDSAPMTPMKEPATSPLHEQSFNEIFSQLPTMPYGSPGKVVKKRAINRFSPLGLNRKSCTSRRFPCNQCQEEFNSLGGLENHTISVHSGYRCHICRTEFTQRSNLQRHALKHVGFKPFECRVCAKAYYRKDHLMRHMEMGHPGFSPRDSINVYLTSSESLDYLNRNKSSVESAPATMLDSHSHPLVVNSPLSVKIPMEKQVSDTEFLSLFKMRMGELNIY